MQVVAGTGRHVLDVPRAELQRPLDVRRAQPAGAGGLQVVVVRGHQHHLLGPQVEHLRRTQVGGRIGLVGAEDLGAQHAVPGQAGALGHVRQQADVAVGQRRDGEAALEQRQSLHAVGPCIQPVPHAVEVPARGLVQMREAEARQDPVEDQPVQLVDARPAQLAAAHALHGGLVARAPGEGEGVGIHFRMQRLHLAHDAAVPVHDGAEDVECQHLHGGGDAVRGGCGHVSRSSREGAASVADSRAPARVGGAC